MVDGRVLIIPRDKWMEFGFRMVQEAERRCPGEPIKISQLGYLSDIQITFSTAEAATMMRLIWSGWSDGIR
jgi:hypothetical protein